MKTLQTYSFPGNVRELENILERAMTLCESDIIQLEDLQLPQTPFDASVTDRSENDSLSLDSSVENREREIILKALEKTRYNKTAAAKLLGVSFRALRYRIKKLGIE